MEEFYEKLFDDSRSLKDRNKILFLYIKKMIRMDDTYFVNKFREDKRFDLLHPSLIKSYQIITSYK